MVASLYHGSRPDPFPPAGSWFISSYGEADGIEVFEYVCPCGCGKANMVTIGPKQTQQHWGWNGDREKPTLTPSLQQYTPCRWHGHVVNGDFVPA